MGRGRAAMFRAPPTFLRVVRVTHDEEVSAVVQELDEAGAQGEREHRGQDVESESHLRGGYGLGCG